MEKKWCPGCDQGWVVPVRVKRIGQTVFVCEECETTWFSAGGIGNAHPKNFVDFMESIGLQGLWTEVEQLPNDTEPE